MYLRLHIDYKLLKHNNQKQIKCNNFLSISKFDFYISNFYSRLMLQFKYNECLFDFYGYFKAKALSISFTNKQLLILLREF